MVGNFHGVHIFVDFVGLIYKKLLNFIYYKARNSGGNPIWRKCTIRNVDKVRVLMRLYNL